MCPSCSVCCETSAHSDAFLHAQGLVIALSELSYQLATYPTRPETSALKASVRYAARRLLSSWHRRSDRAMRVLRTTEPDSMLQDAGTREWISRLLRPK